MKALSFLVFLCASLAWTQTAPPSEADLNKVIANFEDGTKMTLGEFQKLIPLLPGVWQDAALKDPTKFLNTFGLLKKEAAEVDRQQLADQSPYKEGLNFAIMEAKARLYVQEAQLSIAVSPEELEKYYNDHKEPFRQVKVSGIKVAFGDLAAPEAGSSSQNASRVVPKARTEEEAKAKAEKLTAQIRAGADFAKLVKIESDDSTSKEKGGALGTWKMTENVPDDLRAAVLGLNEGEVSDPIKQAGGYWIVHVDAVIYTPLDEVKDAIFSQLKQEKAGKWLNDAIKSVHVDIVKNDPAPPSPSDPKK
jgi:parvulin-like peptidyl-prolyl isomerase